MFGNSTQMKHFMFGSEEEINEKRRQHTTDFVEKYGQSMNTEERLSFFITPEEERQLILVYEQSLMDFCRRFEPPMPKFVCATALHYFKRFYITNSVMEYHPKEMLVTCVYLACKVEEFNVSIGQFVNNVPGNRNRASDIVLSNELLLMSKLNYYLCVHHPYRPIEGFLIEIKTYKIMENAERMRPHIDEFLDMVIFTDACFLYPPSQIALAAVLHSAKKLDKNIDLYITDMLFKNARNKIRDIVDSTKKIRRMYENYKPINKEQIRDIEAKLELCRNQENNPDSEIYKERLRKSVYDDDLEIIEEDDSSSHPIADSSTDLSLLNTTN